MFEKEKMDNGEPVEMEIFEKKKKKERKQSRKYLSFRTVLQVMARNEKYRLKLIKQRVSNLNGLVAFNSATLTLFLFLALINLYPSSMNFL